MLDEAADGDRARETLRDLNVDTVRSIRQPVASLSGGQRQSVAVAKAVMSNAKLVIMDEPTAALGVAQTRMVLDLIKTARRARRGGDGDLAQPRMTCSRSPTGSPSCISARLVSRARPPVRPSERRRIHDDRDMRALRPERRRIDCREGEGTWLIPKSSTQASRSSLRQRRNRRNRRGGRADRDGGDRASAGAGRDDGRRILRARGEGACATARAARSRWSSA